MLVTLHQPLYFSRGFREGGESCDDEIIVFMTETREKYLCPFILMPNIKNAQNSCDCHCLKKLYVDKSLWRNILKLTITCDWFYLCRHLLMTMYICISTYLLHWTALFLCGLVSRRPPILYTPYYGSNRQGGRKKQTKIAQRHLKKELFIMLRFRNLLIVNRFNVHESPFQI